MKKIIGSILVAGTFACGVSNSIDGTVDGRTFDAKDAIVMSNGHRMTGFVDVVGFATVVIGNVADGCSLIKANKTPQNLSTLTLVFRHSTGEEALPVTPGEYKVQNDASAGGSAGRVVFAGFDQTD